MNLHLCQNIMVSELNNFCQIHITHSEKKKKKISLRFEQIRYPDAVRPIQILLIRPFSRAREVCVKQSFENVFLCQTWPRGDLLMYANPPFIREIFKKLASDWLSAGSNVVASESMIFVFEFNSKPFAYSPKRNFLSTFSHSLSCVDCILCRLVLCFGV